MYDNRSFPACCSFLAHRKFSSRTWRGRIVSLFSDLSDGIDISSGEISRDEEGKRRVVRVTLATFFSWGIASATVPWDIENSLCLCYMYMYICAHCVCMCVYVCAITSITSHTSVCGGDENEKKGRDGRKDPDCESPAGMKRRVGRRSCFALSDRSRGLRQCLSANPLPTFLPFCQQEWWEESCVCCPGGQNIFISVEWRVNAAARDVPASFFFSMKHSWLIAPL